MQRVLGLMGCVALALVARGADPTGTGYPDLSTFRRLFAVPAVTDETPAAGRRVRLTLPDYEGSGVYGALYLPTDWTPGRSFPVLVEYAGNGDYRNKYGDVSTGRVEDSSLGYGLSGPSGYIWLCLPYVDAVNRRNEIKWWGDVAATVDFCKRAVALVCAQYGGRASAVVLCGFSRGAIACNFIGLHDDEIAGLWCGFLASSHYDGARAWPYPGSDRASARARLERLRGRPVLVAHESYDIAPGTYSIVDTVNYLAGTGLPLTGFRFLALGIRNHADAWTSHDLPERRIARQWLHDVIARAGATPVPR